MLTEDGIVIAFDVAAILGTGRLRRLVEEDARRSGIVLPAQVVGFLTELEAVRRAVDAAGAPSVSPVEADRFPQVEGVSVTTFAAATGTTVQNVRQRCRRGTLDCWRNDRGAWRIDPKELP